MTVIVLNSDEDTVVLAADQQWTDDTDVVFFASKIQHITKGHKVIGAIATAGDARRGLMFEEAIKACFSESANNSDVLALLNQVCEEFDGKIPNALLVIRGVGYHIDDDGLVLKKDRWILGSGGNIALGAMWNRKGSAEKLSVLGCRAAIALTSGCGGNVDVFTMPRADEY